MSYAGIFTDKNNTDHPVTSTLYGTCSTAAATADKVVVCSNVDVLTNGMTLRVVFENGNTASDPTLNVNSLGAKAVYRFGTTKPVGDSSWEAGAVVDLMYNGTSFYMLNSDDIGSLKNDISAKQDATDNNLTTADKTVVGAVNEIKSGLTDLSDHVDGDAVTYPYADVITINDAVPANLADCSVKVEPVQDLHGYDKPWVGGAGKNKLDISTITLAVEKGFTASKDDSTGLITIAGTYTGTAAGYGFFLFTTTYIPDTKVVMIDESVSMQGNSLYWDGTTGRVVCNLYNLVQGQSYNFTFKLMIVDNSLTPTSYEHYSNICPISGHTEAVVTRDGKNLWNKDITTQGYFDANGDISESASWNYDYIKINSGSTLTVSGCVENTTAKHCWFDKDKRFISVMSNHTDGTYTAPSNACYAGVCAKNTGTSSDTDTLQVELSSSATPYEPYKGQQYTLALGDTIYGGTVDFDSGVMTVTHRIIMLKDLSWSYLSQNTRFIASISGAKIVDASTIADISCEICKTVSWGDYGQANYDCICLANISGTNYVGLKCFSCESVEDLLVVLDNYKMTYPIATPTTIQLTPQQIQLLKGTNTLYASTGQISVTVNGVSGAIGQVQEQVNELAEEVAEIKPVNYSTTEQKTGQKWIDGKDIYRKTFASSGGSYTSPISIAHGISNIETVVDKNGSLYYGSTYHAISIDHAEPGNSVAYSIINADNIVLNYGSDYSGVNAISKYDVTLYYTKTT